MDIFDQPSFLCPYCGSENTADFDVSAGRSQQWIQDCETCCRPIKVCVYCEDDDQYQIDAVGENS